MNHYATPVVVITIVDGHPLGDLLFDLGQGKLHHWRKRISSGPLWHTSASPGLRCVLSLFGLGCLVGFSMPVVLPVERLSILVEEVTLLDLSDLLSTSLVACRLWQPQRCIALCSHQLLLLILSCCVVERACVTARLEPFDGRLRLNCSHFFATLHVMLPRQRNFDSFIAGKLLVLDSTVRAAIQTNT